MPNSTIEIGQVRMSFAGGAPPPARAENISRLALERVQMMMDERGGNYGVEGGLDRVTAGPVRVSFDTMDDNDIARASAVEIYRALLGAL